MNRRSRLKLRKRAKQQDKLFGYQKQAIDILSAATRNLESNWIEKPSSYRAQITLINARCYLHHQYNNTMHMYYEIRRDSYVD